jgi:hypothetical protein
MSWEECAGTRLLQKKSAPWEKKHDHKTEHHHSQGWQTGEVSLHGSSWSITYVVVVGWVSVWHWPAKLGPTLRFCCPWLLQVLFFHWKIWRYTCYKKYNIYIYIYLFGMPSDHHDLFCLEPGSVNLGLASSHGWCHLWPKMCSPQRWYNEILSALTRFVFSQVNYHITLKTKTYSEFWSQAFYILLDSTSPPMSRRLCRPNGLQVRLMTVDKNLSWF